MKPIQSPFHFYIRLDSFLASIVEQENPSWTGRPIVISEFQNGQKVVLSANQIAQKLGIKKGQAIQEVKQRCAWTHIQSADLGLAKEYAQNFFSLLGRFSTKIELGKQLDEAFLQLDQTQMAYSAPAEFANTIQRAIQSELGLSASIGISRAKSVAWSASLQRRPGGITPISIGDEKYFLHPLPLDRLYTLGKRTRAFLEQKRITTIGQLAKTDSVWLQSQLGVTGLELQHIANAQDPQEIQVTDQQKTISRSLSFDLPMSSQGYAFATLKRLEDKANAALNDRGRRPGLVILQCTDVYGRSHQKQHRLRAGESTHEALVTLYSSLVQSIPLLRSMAVTYAQLLDSPKRKVQALWKGREVQSALLKLHWRARGQASAKKGQQVPIQFPLMARA